MVWTAVLLSGIVSGFFAGASPAPTGGNMAAAFPALLLVFLAGSGAKAPNAEYLGGLVTGFVLALLLGYIGGNILRARHLLRWMGHGTPRSH